MCDELAGLLSCLLVRFRSAATVKLSMVEGGPSKGCRFGNDRGVMVLVGVDF